MKRRQYLDLNTDALSFFQDGEDIWEQDIGLSPKERAVLLYLSNKSATGALAGDVAMQWLYLANRESVQRYRYPIAPLQFPVGVHGVHAPIFSSGIETEKETLLGELSEADIECLDATWDRFGHWNAVTLATWMNDQSNLPELSASGTVSLVTLLYDQGVDSQSIRDLIEKWEDDAWAQYVFDKLLGCANER